MRSAFALMAILIAWSCPVLAQSAASPPSPPSMPTGVELPIEVRLSVRILNITRLIETTGELSASIEYTQRWVDPGLRFDPVAKGEEHIDLTGAAAEARLGQIWRPGITIDNMIGNPRSQTVFLSIFYDGRVVQIRRLDADFRIRANMSSFPFDTQYLPLSFSTARHAAHEVALTTTEFDRNFSTIDPDISANNWKPRGVSFVQSTFFGWNARPFSRITLIATVERDWTRYILRLFVPFIAIMSLSLFLLWASTSVLPNTQRVPMVFSTLLALAALSFTFEASFPGSISMNSPIAAMISMGYLYLPVVLVIDLFPGLDNSRFARRFPYLLPELRRNLRLTVPLLFLGLCLYSLLPTIER